MRSCQSRLLALCEHVSPFGKIDEACVSFCSLQYALRSNANNHCQAVGRRHQGVSMGLVMRDNPWAESIGFGDVVHGGVLGFSPSTRRVVS